MNPYLCFLSSFLATGVVNPLIYDAFASLKSAAAAGTEWGVKSSLGIAAALAFYYLVAKFFRL